jgi:catechol 2,3-dioxygenase-like lactoylglutathione lyase family enzyme
MHDCRKPCQTGTISGAACVLVTYKRNNIVDKAIISTKGAVMKLGYVIIYTQDVVASVAFYEKAFQLTRRFVHESKQYAEMETGATALAFVCDDLAAVNVPHPYRKNSRGDAAAGIEIALTTPDIETAYQHAVTNGATSVLAPLTKPWGQTIAYVLDNNGVLVELATPMGE